MWINVKLLAPATAGRGLAPIRRAQAPEHASFKKRTFLAVAALTRDAHFGLVIGAILLLPLGYTGYDG